MVCANRLSSEIFGTLAVLNRVELCTGHRLVEIKKHSSSAKLKPKQKQNQ